MAQPHSKAQSQLSSRIPRLLLAGLIFWAPVILFAKLADSILEQEHLRIDSDFLSWLHHYSSPLLDKIVTTITNTGSAEVVTLITAAAIGYLLTIHHRRNATILLFGVGGAALANIILKLWFHRSRPALWSPLVTENTYSFPSGHAMASSALAFSLIAICWPTRWRWPAIIIGSLYILAVGGSRLYLGVHFPTDVIAGWCVSFVWVIIVTQIVHHLTHRTPSNSTPKSL